MPVDYLQHWNKRHLIIFRILYAEETIISVSGVSVDNHLRVSGSVLHILRRQVQGHAPYHYKHILEKAKKGGLPDKFFLTTLQNWIELKIKQSAPTTHYGSAKLQLAMFWSVEEYYTFREYMTPALYDLYFERTTILSSLFYTRQDCDIFLRGSCSNLKQSLTNFSTYLKLAREGYDPLYECSLMREIFLELLLLDLAGVSES